MDPAAAALDLAKAGAIIANMIESYLAAGAPPFNAEGADHAESEDCRSSSDAESLHLHSSVDDGASALQSGEHRAPVQSGGPGEVAWLDAGADPNPRRGASRAKNSQGIASHFNALSGHGSPHKPL